MVSLLCYFLCMITVLTAVAGAMIGLFISTSVRVGHTAHTRPAIERDGSEQRLFMVVPETRHGSPAKSAAVLTEKADAKKSKPHKDKVLVGTTTSTGTR